MAGYCSRHRMNKVGRLHELCKTDVRYYDRWEKTTHERNERVSTAQYNHWMPLHSYAAKHWDDWDAKEAHKWYRRWHSTIPKSGCNCKGGWLKITKKLRPVFTTAREFFEWSWKTHDMVNEKLSKPYRPTLEETYAIWCPDRWKISSLQ